MIAKKRKKLYKWLTKKHKIKNPVTTTDMFRWAALLIPFYGILYLTTYFSFFNVAYFIYFDPLDFLKVFYEKNQWWFYLLLLFSFVVLVFYQYYKKQKGKLHWNLVFVIYSLIILILVLFIFNSGGRNDLFIKNILLLLLLFYLVSMYGLFFLKSLHVVFYFSMVCFVLTSVIIAKRDALYYQNKKVRFDIVLNDGTFLLEEDSGPASDYYIGSTTRYVFVYDTQLKKVRAHSFQEIREIRFKAQMPE